MEKELPDHHAIPRKVLLEVANVFKAFLPDFLSDHFWRQVLFLQEFLMHADHQDFFVIRAVEDADLSALRQLLRGAPKKIMVQFFGGGLLEARYFAGLRIYP